MLFIYATIDSEDYFYSSVFIFMATYLGLGHLKKHKFKIVCLSYSDSCSPNDFLGLSFNDDYSIPSVLIKVYTYWIRQSQLDKIVFVLALGLLPLLIFFMNTVTAPRVPMVMVLGLLSLN